MSGGPYAAQARATAAAWFLWVPPRHWPCISPTEALGTLADVCLAKEQALQATKRREGPICRALGREPRHRHKLAQAAALCCCVSA
ncbi:hypothetical protein WJX81_001123 [Elliptochloris bilobata]|uniref:Secreted protein n=1 Tax=Elliptochloris bilobata TaxID=381761 RepID=A0AAW1SCX5_9CHLO